MAETDGRDDGTDSQGDALSRLMAALGPQKGRGPAPVERWNPDYCGEIDMRIDADGTWFYMGTPIGRPALVKLFSTVLRKDPERFVLVTPVERIGIEVADAPFAAVEMAVDGAGDSRTIAFRTNVDDFVEVGPDHPLRFDAGEDDGVKPYVRVRGGLWARVTRALTYDLVDLGEERQVDGRTIYGVAVAGEFYLVPDGAGRVSDALTIDGAFEARASERLRREPPNVEDKRADLKGDHALANGNWLSIHGAPPKVAAVLIPVVAHPGAPTVLLTERAASLRQHSGQIAFPGGKMDPEDATPLATALREAEEEIGLDPARVRPLGYLDAYLSGTNYFIIPALGLIEPGFSLRLNRQEVESVFEVPLSFLMDEENHELHARDWREKVRTYYAMPFGDRYIWGVTAGILRNMHERLYGR